MNRLHAALWIAVAVLVTACYSDHSELQRRIEMVKRQEGEPIEPLPTISTPPSFEYAVQDRRAPFDTSVVEQAPDAGDAVAEGSGPTPDFNRRREALEAFELDSLEMVGTFDIEDELYGLVEDPDGLLHRVRPGNFAGRNHGRIVAVYEDRIELIELLSEGEGRWREANAALALDEPQD